MRRNWLSRSALVLLPAAAAGALTAVATQPSAAHQASPAYHVSSAFYAAPAAPVTAQLTASTESIGNRILDEAETRTGDWYVYGGFGAPLSRAPILYNQGRSIALFDTSDVPRRTMACGCNTLATSLTRLRADPQIP